MVKIKPEAKPDKPRIITPMDEALIDQLDREWHKRRLSSRSETIRVLLREAMAK